MGKETREKTRNQRNSAPYNVSNSSFARRFTSKVAEYIPSGWASGWFDHTEKNDDSSPSTSNPNVTQVQVEINHVENTSPSPKRSSLSNHNNIASNSNNRTAYTTKSNALGNETCSPILTSDRHPRDYQPAGPSGFSQPNKPSHNLFVASTPAFNVNKQPSGGGDNGSESGESTSGCSSLISQSNKQLRQGGGIDLGGKSKSLFPNRQIPAAQELAKSHNKSSGPQFDASLFNTSATSLNKSVNLSPFYPGRTMYGGASTYRKYSIGSNNKSGTTSSPSVFQPSLQRRASLCAKSKVTPSPTTLPKMSVVAENILKTINAMTPVTLLMSMPRPEEVNASPTSLRGLAATNGGVKRKLPELQIPTVVNSNLLQLKASERKNALSQSIQDALSSSSSSSDEDLDYAIVSNDAKRSLKEKMKRARRGNNSRHEEVQTEVKLPDAVLNVPSLPVIDISLTKLSKSDPDLDVSFSDPIECRNFNISSETSLLSVSSSQGSDVNSSSVNFVYNSESSKAKPRWSVTLPAVEASPPRDMNVLPVTKKKETPARAADTWNCDICLSKFNESGSVCKACGMPQNKNNELSMIPAASTESSQPVEVKASAPLSDRFKPAADTWECDACCVRNKADATACVCCTTPKPGIKPAATPTPAPVISSAATPSTTSSGFGDLFKKPSGSWECPACMISNKSADDKCVACETAKPGAKPAAAPTNVMSGPKFPFATSSDTPSFKFGVDKVDAKSPTPPASTIPTATTPLSTAATSAAPTFSFGMPPATTSAQSTTLPAFSFGMPKPAESASKKDSVTAVIAPTQSTPSSFTFKSNSSLPSPAESKTPTPAVTSTSEVKTTPLSTPSFSFGNTNGPVAKPLASVASPSPVVEAKSPEVKETPPASSLFGNTTSFLSNNSAASPKPLTSLFGHSAQNNVDASKSVNSFDSKTVNFNLTPASNGEQPPSKMIDFGKPAVTSAAVEPSKPSIFGAAVFEKPKENNVFGFGAATSNSLAAPVNSNAAAPPAFPSKTEASVFAFGTMSKPASNSFPATPSAPVFSFGNPAAAPAPQANAAPGLNFASPTPSPAFSFGASANSVAPPSVNNVQPPMFGNAAPATGSLFGNSVQPAAPAPMFGAGGGFSQSVAATPNPAPAPFSFGAPNNNASAGFSFGAQNVTPAPASGAFSFGAPSAPPTFDPKMRPSFNFTAGAAPTFSAQPGLTASSLGARRIKKAVRRK